MAVSQERISVHSLADLKNTSDDAIPIYLNSLKFAQNHTLSDTRLALGYSAFFICAASFYWDYTLGFESTKHYTAIAVAVYTLLNGILTFWIWGVEKGTIYIGTSAAGDKIQVASKTEKHVPVYNLTITVWRKGDKEGKVVRIKRPFTQWFDAKGGFVVLPFQQMIASAVDVVGELDPRKVVKKEKKVVGVEGGEQTVTMDDKWASLLAESSGVSLGGGEEETAAPKSSKKRNKKAM